MADKMVVKVLAKKNWRDESPELLATIETWGGPVLGDIIEVDGNEYNVIERRWNATGLSVIVEPGTGKGVVKA